MFPAFAAFCVSCAWLVVHGVKVLSRRWKPLLPLSQGRRRSTEITVKNVHLRIQTTIFNARHDALSAHFASREYLHVKQAICYFYHVGSFLGVIGMLGAFALLLWTTATLCGSVFFSGDSITRAEALVKRSFEEDNIAPISNTQSRDAFAVRPIIPGVTVPISDLPLILLALCASQFVHEFGHAITAALHRVPMISSGISIILVIPSAFVSLSSAYLEELLARDRLQIVAAGCFHNLLLWCALVAAARTGIGPYAWAIVGYADVSARGRVVVRIDGDSPLQTHLPVGSLITRLNDFPLNSSEDGDLWSQFLLDSPNLPAVNDLGWCANVQPSDGESLQCCATEGQGSLQTSTSCFVSFQSPRERHCVDPIPIMTQDRNRCTDVMRCGASEACIKPRDHEELLRISVQRDSALREPLSDEVILWAGPKTEIWEQVEIGTLVPRLGFLPPQLPYVVIRLFGYLMLTNFSLFLLNLLPLPGLDGTQLLVIVLELAFNRFRSEGAVAYDIEALGIRRRQSRESSAQAFCRTAISTSTIALLASCTILGIVNWMTR
ncbi:hypothetical protein BV22DRAFT_1099015 [Leucogyrophana mollusca]|uniref:Uncharacterized protein n=1 Tax=Leucogyrophana mollusca TaxID=85980 RepID=A0ACB8B4Q8_9AGAM|nr:hypothetical protein BV22DRAFT_1099015 [Leucogyrophana mollusca]